MYWSSELESSALPVPFTSAEQGTSVVILESQNAPATGSTARSAAGVRVQFTEEVNIRISWESIQTYQPSPTLWGEDAEYRPHGYLLLVPPERWAAHLDSVKLQQRIGVPVNVLRPEEAQSIVPFDTADIAGTTHGLADGVIDPHRVTLAYLRMAQAEEHRFMYRRPLPARNERAMSGKWKRQRGFLRLSIL